MSLQEEHEVAGSPVTSRAPAEPAGSPSDKLGLALLVIAAAQLMLVLDDTIMNVALPSVQKALGFAPEQLNWVITAYALTFGGLLLAGGRAGDLFGRRRVFRIGVTIFTLASLVGGFAQTSEMLVGSRLAQGVGAAIAAPTAMSLLVSTFPAGPSRTKALGVYGAMGGLGSVLGLLLGGALTEFFSWRWVLFINVPIAVAVLLGTSVLVKGLPERREGGIDIPGALTATLGTGSLIYAISRISEHGWDDTRAIALLAVGVVLLIAFLVIQFTSPAAMIPGRVVSSPFRLGAYSVMLLVGMGMLALFYFLTLYMQAVKGYGAMRTGVSFLPFAVGIGLAAGGIGPQLLNKLNARVVVGVGLLVAAVGMAWFSVMGPTSAAWSVLLPAQFVTGFGLGLTLVTITVVGVHGVEARDSGIAAGLINTSQQLGGAVGLAALAGLATSVTSHRPAGTPPLTALTDGFSAGFLVSGALFVIALVIAVATLNVKVEAEH